MSTQITPQQRAQNFGAYTRQHKQTLGSKTGHANDHIEFEVPKARLLQGISLLCKVVVNKGAGVLEFNSVNDKLSLYDVLRRISIDYNNGFSPVVASGKDIAVLNMLRIDPKTIIPTSTRDFSLCTITNDIEYETNEYLTVKTEDEKIEYYFMLELPLTLNERDPVGLILAQNGQTLINFSVDIANKVMDKEVESVKVTPIITSFSVPTSELAFPDLSVLKVVDSRKEVFSAGAPNVIKLPIGMIYRKIIFGLFDENGKAITPDKITSNIELIFNGADVPYSVDPQALRLMTVTATGSRLPDGYYAFDFATAGVPNMAGSRDYIDCETLSTFEVRFTSSESGKLTIISEKISRLV